MLPELAGELGHQDDVAVRGSGLQLAALAISIELRADAENVLGVVDVAPAERKDLAQSEAGEDAGLDGEPVVTARGSEQLLDFLAVQEPAAGLSRLRALGRSCARSLSAGLAASEPCRTAWASTSRSGVHQAWIESAA